MKREIKFRAKRTDRNDEVRWVYGHYFTAPLTDENSGLPAETGWFFLSGGERMHCIEQDGVSFVIHVETLGQFTGLKDKNGVEIYEGDIVHLGDPNIRYTIMYRDGSFTCKQHGNRSTAGLAYWLERVEVIGNIYENSELLKGDEIHAPTNRDHEVKNEH